MRQARPLAARVIAGADPSPSGCLVWRGAVDRSGYARINYQGRNWKASRAIWTVLRGPILDGLHVLHVCDNRLCVNVEHLFLGTNAENMADMVAKGRSPRSSAKLTEEQVRAIRNAADVPHANLAAAYGVTENTIYFVVTRRTWRHL